MIAADNTCQIGGGGVLLRVRQSGRIDEVRISQSEPRSLAVHLLDKEFFAAGNAFRQRDGRVVA